MSELYTKGAPRSDAHVVRTFETRSHWRLRATLTPLENDVVARIQRLPLRDHGESEFERWARVEWQPWQFGSRRAWVLCALCGARCSRFYLYRGATLFGSIACRGCAGVRYRSQDANPADRLVLKIDSLRVRLGGRPTGGGLGHPWPVRPSTMQHLPYLRALEELERLEAALAEELGVLLPRVTLDPRVDDPARRILARVREARAVAKEPGE